MADAAPALVRIRRGRYFGGAARTWLVFVDGEEAATLRAGDDRELKVRAGRHRIEVRPGRPVRSETIDISLSEGEIVEIECRPAGGFRLRPAIVVQTVPAKVFGDAPDDASGPTSARS